MIPTFARSAATVVYAETLEAKEKVVSVLTYVQRFLPKGPRDDREPLALALSGLGMSATILYSHPESVVGMFQTNFVARPAVTMELRVQPTDPRQPHPDNCELFFVGSGRDVDEAWSVMSSRVKNARL